MGRRGVEPPRRKPTATSKAAPSTTSGTSPSSHETMKTKKAGPLRVDLPFDEAIRRALKVTPPQKITSARREPIKDVRKPRLGK